MDSYLKNIIQGIVTKPDDVKVVLSQDPLGTLLTVTVDKGDMGLVIGRDGETAKAIRNIIRSVGMKNQTRAAVRFLEPNGERYSKKI